MQNFDVLEKYEISNVIESLLQLLSYFGMWRPKVVKSPWAIRIYLLYSAVIIINIGYFGLTFLILLYLNRDKIAVYPENIFSFTTICLISFKLAYMNFYRDDINELLSMFWQKHCFPFNDEEAAIHRKFNQKQRSILLIFVPPSVLVSLIGIMWPLTNSKNTIPFERWLFYSLNSRKRYWMTYLYENSLIIFIVTAYASFETLLVTFTQHICMQLEVLIYRLLKIMHIRNDTCEKLNIYEQECKIIRECVNQHVHIFSMERKLNNTFSFVVFFQFFISTLNLCTAAFYLTKMKISDGHFWISCLVIYCFITQIFIHCYFGEELTKTSISISDKICQMDWNILSIRTQKKLIIMMMRAKRPIQFTGASIVVFSIETFCKVLKASYTTFNVLQSSS